MKECPKCHFVLEDNKEVEKVIKMLKIKKSNSDNLTYPILVADFKCKTCENVIHLKWSDVEKDINVETCEKCKTPLTVSVFLGLMNGFNLKSVCFSCYTEINNGNIGGFQK